MPDVIEVIRGDTPTIRLGPVRRNGAIVNLTGAVAVLTVKADPEGGPTLFERPGILAAIEQPNDGFDFKLLVADTEDLAGEAVWDAQVTELDGTITTFPEQPPGTWRTLSDVTRP